MRAPNSRLKQTRGNRGEWLRVDQTDVQESGMVAAWSHHTGRDLSSLSACGAANEIARRFGTGKLAIPFAARTSGMLAEVVWPIGMRGVRAGQSRPQGHH